MLSPQALVKGLVSRLLPAVNADSANSDVAFRQGRYGELCTMPLVRKAHSLLDEGTYFTTNNGQAGLAMNTTNAFSPGLPFFIIQNQDSPGGKRIYLDYACLVNTVAGTAASGLTFTGLTIVTDSALRYSSAGTALTSLIVSPNQDLSSVKSVATVYAGVPAATTATAAARVVVGQRVLRPAATGAIATVVGDSITMNFGGVEAAGGGTVTLANANLYTLALPAVVIGPQQSALIYIYYQTSTTPVAAQWAPELGWWER